MFKWRKSKGLNLEKNEAEAAYFGRQDNLKQRSVAWSSIPYFQQQLQRSIDIGRISREHLAQQQERRALALAPGDMLGEYAFLSQIGAKSIDAYDISEGQRDKFFERAQPLRVPVQYHIADVNTIELEDESYDFVYVQQAFHHFEALEHVARAINKALKPDGRFVLIDYIGANFLQRTTNQRKYCSQLWQEMPERYRRGQHGEVVGELFIPDKTQLSPYEAIRSEEIMGILNTELVALEVFSYAAILFPLFNGFAQNYSDSDEDQQFIREMWNLDRQVIESGEVEPNFVRGVFAKRS